MRPLPVCHLTIARHMPEPCLGSRCSAWVFAHRTLGFGCCGLLPRTPEAWQDPASKAEDPGLAEAGAMVAEVLDRDACTLEVSTRAYFVIERGLSRRGDDGEWRHPTLRELCECTRTDLLRLPGCGRVTVAEIERVLAAEGLALRDEP